VFAKSGNTTPAATGVCKGVYTKEQITVIHMPHTCKNMFVLSHLTKVLGFLSELKLVENGVQA
jgi:hypothetical protein